MTELSHRVWFVRETPTKLIQLHPSLSLDLRNGDEWFEKLKQDIAKNGLMNPIVVQNQTAPCDDIIPCRIVHGSNRYRAIRQLEWRVVPTLIVGVLPQAVRKIAKELHSVEEAQSYIVDGTFINHKTGCRVVDSKFAQTCEYVRNPEPYFDL